MDFISNKKPKGWIYPVTEDNSVVDIQQNEEPPYVESVVGRSGQVTLSASDIIGLSPLATTLNIPISSFNGGVGSSEFTFWRGDGVWGELPEFLDTNLVSSVAGRTGHITLSASDIIGLTFLDTNLVSSVAGRTGHITLSASDIIGLTSGGGTTATAIKTGNYTAVANDRVRVSTASANVDITLPASPSEGDIVEVVLVTDHISNTVTVSPDTTDKINGTNQDWDGRMSKEGDLVICRYDEGDAGWTLSFIPAVGGVSLTFTPETTIYTTPGIHTRTIPAGATQVELKLWGAAGEAYVHANAQAGPGGFTTAIIPILPATTTDPDKALVVVHLHGNGADESQVFKDSSRHSASLTVGGNVKIDSAQYVFGGSSIYFDGTGDYLSLAGAPTYDLKGNFTIKLKFRASTVTGVQQLWGIHDGTYHQLAIKLDGTTLKGYSSSAGVSHDIMDGTTLGSSIAIDTWYDVELSKKGTAWKSFLDGVKVADFTDADSPDDFTGSNIFWGGKTVSTEMFTGWMDEFIIWDGVAKNTVNFTPRTTEWPDSYALREGDTLITVVGNNHTSSGYDDDFSATRVDNARRGGGLTGVWTSGIEAYSFTDIEFDFAHNYNCGADGRSPVGSRPTSSSTRKMKHALPANSKVCWELSAPVATNVGFGICTSAKSNASQLETAGQPAWCFTTSAGQTYSLGVAGADYATPPGDAVYTLAIDTAVGDMWIAVNGTWQSGNPALGTSPTWTGITNLSDLYVAVSNNGNTGQTFPLTFENHLIQHRPSGFRGAYILSTEPSFENALVIAGGGGGGAYSAGTNYSPGGAGNLGGGGNYGMWGLQISSSGYGCGGGGRRGGKQTTSEVSGDGGTGYVSSLATSSSIEYSTMPTTDPPQTGDGDYLTPAGKAVLNVVGNEGRAVLKFT